MKTKQKKHLWTLRMVIMTIAISFLHLSPSFSANSAEEILLNGELWNNSKDVPSRSYSPISIHAYTDGNYLYIQNDQPDCDITVTISHAMTGSVLYEQTYPEAHTAFIVIALSDLSSGQYRLQLTHSRGGSLTGIFNK